MQVWNVLHAARWNYRTQKGHKNWPSALHHTNLSGYNFATKAYIDNLKKIVKQQYLLHMQPQYCELPPTNGRDRLAGLSTPTNFNGVRVLASLLQRRSSTEVHQTLYDVWPSAGLVYYINIFVGSCPLTEFCQAQIHVASKSCVLLFWQRYCTALEQWASAILCGMVQGMELWNFCSSSFSTEGVTCIPRAAIT